MNWKDATSYSQGQRGKAAQTAWKADFEGVIVWVSCGHIDYRGSWVMRCRELGIDLERLEVADGASSELARDKAIETACHKASLLAVKMRAVSDVLFATHKLSE
tara:strand:- start:239 stop:550 length:312 start_codon:yes stop_codon:yes gene_type:complete